MGKTQLKPSIHFAYNVNANLKKNYFRLLHCILLVEYVIANKPKIGRPNYNKTFPLMEKPLELIPPAPCHIESQYKQK